MRHLNILAFDEMVTAAVASPATTSAELNSKLGMYDQLSLHFVVDNVTAAGTLNMAIMHSNDGRNWITKTAPNAFGGIIGLTAAPTSMANTGSLSVGSSGQFHYLDLNTVTNPSLGLVQVWMWWTVTTGAAHVKLHVSARDQGGR